MKGVIEGNANIALAEVAEAAEPEKNYSKRILKNRLIQRPVFLSSEA